MKQIRYLFGGLLFLFASIGSVTAQEVSDYSKLQPSDYSSITLPPLDLLFENAKSAPTYELATVKEQIERKLLAKEKRAFLGFFSLRGIFADPEAGIVLVDILTGQLPVWYVR